MLSAGGVSGYGASNLFAVLPGGPLAEALRQPQDRVSASARSRPGAHRRARPPGERGPHGHDVTSARRRRLRPSGSPVHQPCVNHAPAPRGERPIGRRFFWESRLQVRWMATALGSNTEAPTIVVNDAFTAGGAQQRGGRHETSFEASSDLDYVRGNHAWRTGVLVEGGRYASNDASDYLGRPSRSRVWPTTQPATRQPTRAWSGTPACGTTRSRQPP